MKRLEKLKKELANYKKSFNIKKAQWEREKKNIKGVKEIKENINMVKREITINKFYPQSQMFFIDLSTILYKGSTLKLTYPHFYRKNSPNS